MLFAVLGFLYLGGGIAALASWSLRREGERQTRERHALITTWRTEHTRLLAAINGLPRHVQHPAFLAAYQALYNHYRQRPLALTKERMPELQCLGIPLPLSEEEERRLLGL